MMAARLRADQVGSFLRPTDLKEAHAAHSEGRLPLDELRRLEDMAIMEVLELQNMVGIDVFSDGEFRRGGWSGDFAEAVEGYVQGAPAVRPTTSTSVSSTPNTMPELSITYALGRDRRELDSSAPATAPTARAEVKTPAAAMVEAYEKS